MTRRHEGERWSQLSMLITTCERLFEMNARLDAYTVVSARRLRFRDVIDHRLAVLSTRIDHEVDRITAERLTAELVRTMAAASRGLSSEVNSC